MQHQVLNVDINLCAIANSDVNYILDVKVNNKALSQFSLGLTLFKLYVYLNCKLVLR